jgi:hypothetical protein
MAVANYFTRNTEETATYTFKAACNPKAGSVCEMCVEPKVVHTAAKTAATPYRRKSVPLQVSTTSKRGPHEERAMATCTVGVVWQAYRLFCSLLVNLLECLNMQSCALESLLACTYGSL